MSYQGSLYDDVDEPDFYADDYIPQKPYRGVERLTAQEIYKRLDDTVYGMEEVKRGVSVFICKALKGIRSEKVILIAAESGTGKSFLIEELSKIVPITVADSSSITASGYKGSNHLTTILNKVDTSGNTPTFIVLDEFNRLLQKGMSGWSETSLLPELLVLFDDKDVSVNTGTDEKPYWVNPKNLFFILIGSFSNLTDITTNNNPLGFCVEMSSKSRTHRKQITKEMILEHLKDYPELIGRINRIFVNPNLTENDYRQILTNPKYSPATKLEQELGLSIKITPKKMCQYIKDCYESNTGVRYVKNDMLEQVDTAIFDNPDIKEIIIK